MQNFAPTKTVKKGQKGTVTVWGYFGDRHLEGETCVRSRIGLVQEQVDTEYVHLSL